MADPTEPISTENVVASTAVDQELDLDALAIDLVGAEYDPDRFPGLIYPVDEPNATALVLRSGEVVITGATSEADVHEAYATLFDEFGDLGIEISGTWPPRSRTSSLAPTSGAR